MKTAFNEWFNVMNKDHLTALSILLELGEWPKHFIPADVEMEANWRDLLLQRVVLEYIKSKTGGPVYRGEG